MLRSNISFRAIGSAGLAIVLTMSLASLLPSSAIASPADDNPGSANAIVPDNRADDLAPAPGTDSSVAPDQRTSILGDDYAQSSDVAYTMLGDSRGLNILVATEASGYTWSSIATLGVRGLAADQWIGNGCRTSDGNHLVVVYAPRSMTNDSTLFNQGGWAAVVDLTTGATEQLGQGFSLAYFDPGCGDGNRFVLTEFTKNGEGTRLTTRSIDDPTTPLASLKVDDVVTSAIPVGDHVVGAGSGGLISLDSAGVSKPVSAIKGVPYYITSDGSGGVAYLSREGETAMAWYLSSAAGDARPRQLAIGSASDLGLASDALGNIYVVGTRSRQAKACLLP